MGAQIPPDLPQPGSPTAALRPCQRREAKRSALRRTLTIEPFFFWDGPARATCGAARRRGRRSGTVPQQYADEVTGGRPAACKAAVAERRHGLFEPGRRHQWAATCCRRAVLHCSGRRGGRPAALCCTVPVRSAMQHSGRFALHDPGSFNGRIRGCYPHDQGSSPCPGASVPARRVRAMRSPSYRCPEGMSGDGGRRTPASWDDTLGMHSFDVVAWTTAA